MGVTWKFKDDVAVSKTMRRDHLTFLAALYSEGMLMVEDLDGDRPTLEFPMNARPLDPHLHLLRQLLDDLLVIEEWLGESLPADRLVPANEVQAITDVAHAIRCGEIRMDFNEIVMTIPKTAEQPEGNHHQAIVEMVWQAEILGRQLLIGKLRANLARVKSTRIDDPTPMTVTVRIEPSDDESAHPIFKLRKLTAEERDRTKAA
jgi:hypothetical protein